LTRKQPLALGLRASVPGRILSLVTEYAANESLASFLTANDQRRLSGPNRMAKVIAGTNFGSSASLDAPALIRPNAAVDWHSIDSRYLAPERYDGTFRCASDVFAFGLILFEILAGQPAFPESLSPRQVAFKITIEGVRPEIPDSVPAAARALIDG
jgi:hypothetical protein